MHKRTTQRRLRTVRRHLLHISAALLLLCCATALNAEVLYQQNFDNGFNRNISLSRIAWQSYSAPDAADITADTRLVLIPPNPGNSADSGGFLAFIIPQGTYAATGVFPKTDATGATITWRMGNSHRTATVRLLVRIEDQWFVSSTTHSNAGYDAAKFSAASPAAITQTIPVTTDARAWQRLTLKPGETLSLGEPSALPSAIINGIGFLVENSAGRAIVRLDSLLIEKTHTDHAP
ncbi:hypothetical protein [Geminisphaera colitermitum]|uniref:hypothetical protein n=1 Tax=Geminisphaera colitermitum TaxID=1148786 RepID=UPI000196540C|nr:hypothetical protein [Geminisphaera colitermitum]